MNRHIGFALSALVLLTPGTAAAQDKQRACALLTADEIAGVVGALPERPGEHDEIIEKGPWKGETHRRCNWPLGPNGRNGTCIEVTAMHTDAQQGVHRSAGQADGRVQGGVGPRQRRALGTRRASWRCTAASEKAVTVASRASWKHEEGLSMPAVLAAAMVTSEQLKALLDKA